jgi:voltage-dependent calcium channel N type alpha-1B
MLLNMEPPVGFGAKCPKILAYRRLIRMNMPVDDAGNVHFTTTLFALIRESLGIKMRQGLHNNNNNKLNKQTILYAALYLNFISRC